VWVEIFPVAATLASGHHLRLAIEASDAPHLTPATPEALKLAGGVLSLYHDAEHPSALVVPVEP
jgi:predicted acyl esterase